MKRIFALLLAALLAVGAFAQGAAPAAAPAPAAAAAPSAEAISKASTAFYYAKSSLEGEALWAALETRQCAVSLATTNPDGSPNAAVVIPGVTKDRGYLIFGIAPNQTVQNLQQRKLAVLTAYIYTPTATEKLERNKGARIVLEYVSDPALVKKLAEENKDKGASEKSTFLRIVRVMPLG